MRVALVTDALSQPTRGNHTTVARWLDHDLGVDLVPIDSKTDSWEGPVPELFHGYHALRGGVAARRLARRYGRPLVVSLGGTDLLSLLKGDEHAEEVASVLGAADCITGAFPSFGELAGAESPFVCVPRAFDPRIELRPRVPDGRLCVLLPASLRPVKDVIFAITLSKQLKERGLPIEMQILGPALHDDYALRVRHAASECSWVRLGELPPEQMGKAYESCDVVWNTSLQEGGANALIEALAHGAAVFARDVIGNRDLLRLPGAPGHLFDGEDLDAAVAFHRSLVDESVDSRQLRAERGRSFVEDQCSPAAERRGLLAAWDRAMG